MMTIYVIVAIVVFLASLWMTVYDSGKMDTTDILSAILLAVIWPLIVILVCWILLVLLYDTYEPITLWESGKKKRKGMGK